MFGPLPPSAPPASFLAAAAAALTTFRASVAALGRPPRSPSSKRWEVYRGAVHLLGRKVKATAHDEETNTYWSIEADIDAKDRVYAIVYANHRLDLGCVLGSFRIEVPTSATEADLRAAYNARVQSEIAALSALLLP